MHVQPALQFRSDSTDAAVMHKGDQQQCEVATPGLADTNLHDTAAGNSGAASGACFRVIETPYTGEARARGKDCLLNTYLPCTNGCQVTAPHSTCSRPGQEWWRRVTSAGANWSSSHTASGSLRLSMSST